MSWDGTNSQLSTNVLAGKPRNVSALTIVAIMDIPTAKPGRLRLAKK